MNNFSGFLKMLLMLILTSFGISMLSAQEKIWTVKNLDAKIFETYKSGSTGQNPKAIATLTELANEARAIKYFKGASQAEKGLMILYYQKGDYAKVLEVSDQAENDAIEGSNDEALSHILRLKGLSFIEMGFLQDGISNLRSALKASKNIKDQNLKHYSIALIYDNLAGYHDAHPETKDSALIYTLRSLDEVKLMSDHQKWQVLKYSLIAFQDMNLGMHFSETDQPQKAERYFLESLQLYQNKPGLSVAENIILYSELAKFYLQENKNEKAVHYALLGINREKSKTSALIRRDLLETLSKAYLHLGNANESKIYLSAFSELNDSIISQGKVMISKSRDKQIDKQDKELKETKTGAFKFYASVAFLSFIILGLIWYYFDRRTKKKYEILIQNIKLKQKQSLEKSEIFDKNVAPEEKLETPQTDILSTRKPEILENAEKKCLSISEETLQTILTKLEIFESEKSFLSKDVSFGGLANQLNTNQKYLGEILKEYRGKKYTDYINGLRISYITGQLYSHPEFLLYKISYLAECAGFSSREVFTSVFKRETGISPSYFIANLKNTN